MLGFWCLGAGSEEPCKHTALLPAVRALQDEFSCSQTKGLSVSAWSPAEFSPLQVLVAEPGPRRIWQSPWGQGHREGAGQREEMPDKPRSQTHPRQLSTLVALSTSTLAHERLQNVTGRGQPRAPPLPPARFVPTK